MNISRFKVMHHSNDCLGVALLRDNRVTYKPDPKAYAWFEARDSAWLSQFQTIVRKLCRNTGHSSKFSIREDIDSGIKVERIADHVAIY